MFTKDDAYTLIINSGFNATKEGITSGWQLDNRGGIPRCGLYGDYGTLNDISDVAGTAMIREFNRIDTGVIHTFTRISVDGNDGAFIEYRTAEDDSLYRLEICGGEWTLVGNNMPLGKVADTEVFDFTILLDLDHAVSTTYINGNDCGTFPLTAPHINLKNFRFATTEKGIVRLTPLAISMTANYAVFEEFSFVTNGVPFGWSLNNATVENGTLNLEKSGKASVGFTPVGGNAIVEYMQLYSRAAKSDITVGSIGNDIVSVTTDERGFYVNGTFVYDCEFDNVWYRIRLELDTEKASILVKINGREVGKLAFGMPTVAVDSLTAVNTDSDVVKLDDFRIFRKQKHDDYVPVPVVPKKKDYIVGMNVCSLWQNGTHWGWACVSPYEDDSPVLGYYDEGNPETADWEIKYTVEHGIDFQAFCIYMDRNNVPQRHFRMFDHIYTGFMNAEYSYLTKFTVIWECANAGSPTSMEEWKNNYVPYFIENYFKDPRFMTIDNRPVLCVFGSWNLSSRLGGNAKVKEAFDYLEEKIREYGFDGMIYLSCGSSSDAIAEMGFDACYAYNWGNSGYQLNVNTASILSSARQGAVYTVPTISVGFNSIPWHGIRFPMMTADDYAAAHEWVKNTYLPNYPKEHWQEKLVMLSTWNEYGEGTYIMPTTDEKGFGYLDVIRAEYTDEPVDKSLNLIPTAAQRYRINHLYPQDFHLLRLKGYYKEPIPVDTLNAVYTIDTSVKHDGLIDNTADITFTADGVSGTAVNHDPMMIINDVEPIELDKIDYIRVDAKLERGSVMQIFYITDGDGKWNEDKGKVFDASTGDSEVVSYYMSADRLGRRKFSGRLAGFRVDPSTAAGSKFTVKSVAFLSEDTTGKPAKQMRINGQTIPLKLRVQVNDSGVLCVPFDPSVGMDFALNCYHEWNKASQTLTLHFIGHKFVFTVGKDSYIEDGIENPLGFTLGELDGLPLIPIAVICPTYTLGDDGVIDVRGIS